ncbi:MAG: hypothetical protein M1376_24570 [Planctomycetes bacterium]|nr:hypothetical protein [Planctomycetota bacterium]
MGKSTLFLRWITEILGKKGGSTIVVLDPHGSLVRAIIALLPPDLARETVLLDQLPPTRELKLQAIRIGDFGIAAIPCEVYGRTGLKIKQDSPLKPTMNISLANGGEGYLPPPDQFPLGGYTTWRARTSCLEVEAEPKIANAVLELLSALANS